MDTLAEIQERHDAVRELEGKLLDLQQVLCSFSFCCILLWGYSKTLIAFELQSKVCTFFVHVTCVFGYQNLMKSC